MDEADAPVRGLVPSIAGSTGVKMFLVLTLALLPLGLIALVASIQAIRTADLEKLALLRVAATQSARKLSSEIQSDQAALRLTVNTLASGSTDGNLCRRAEAFLHARSGNDTVFAIHDRTGRRLCGSHMDRPEPIPAARRFDGPDAELLPASGMLAMRMRSSDRRIVSLTYYSRAYLDGLTDAVAAVQNRQIWLRQGNARMLITGTAKSRNLGRPAVVSARVEPTDLVLTMMVRDPPVTLARALSMSLPLVMWFAAAAIVWFFVNRLLIRPLVELRRVVASYQPGQVIEPMKRIRTPAREIAALGETFREISEDVATHENEMEASLERQRRLTREVHHRVKNNLQIIASLINLHARSATAPEANDAYASIQRRVDALSVVHRNHYAELEENRGVGIRALVSELSASLRATNPRDAGRLVIQTDSDNLHVSQDVAVPIAFLITELAELAMLIDPATILRISVRAGGAQGKAVMTVESPALQPSARGEAFLDQRFGRVLTGLARQLRSPLAFDAARGAYGIEIVVSD
jgi:two-component sensor histidine kinase